MKLLFLDVETTGVDENKNKVIEVSGAMVESDDFRQLEGFDAQLNYHNDITGPISLGALAVNGATLERITDVDRNTVSWDLGLKSFANWLVEIRRRYKDFTVCGHNVHFDIKFLKAALNSIGITGLEDVIGHRYLDTAAVALMLKDIGLLQVPKVNMEDLAKAMSLNAPPHTASGDTQQTIHLYERLRLAVTSNLRPEVTEKIEAQKAKEREASRPKP